MEIYNIISSKISNIKRDRLITSVILIVIIAISILMLIHIYTAIPIEAETPSYILPTIALSNRLSISLNQSDIDTARQQFPSWAHKYEFDDLIGSKLVVTDDGRWYSFYWITYSVICIPFYLLFLLFGLNPINAFLLTNLAVYIAALLVVWLLLKRSLAIRLTIILLLVCNPILFYMSWVSAEVFIFSMIVISFVFFTNQDYKKAAIFISLAGSMNITAMFCGLAMILHYFITNYKEQKSIKRLILVKWNDILLYACCFLPGLIPVFFNLVIFNSLTPTAVAGSFSGVFGRALAYLFDLSLGILPYFAVLLILFFLVSIYGLFKRSYTTLCYLIAFLGTIFSFSLITHINSGMTGIARYNAWIVPVMIFYVTTHGSELFFGKLKKALYALVYSGISLTTLVLLLYTVGQSWNPIPGTLFAFDHSPIARIVLNNVPQLYNPLYSTFISRTARIDGGYIYSGPVIYTDDDGIIRKILVTPETVNQLENMIAGDYQSLAFLEKRMQEISNRRGFQYINISRFSSVMLIKTPPLGINASGEIGDDAFISGNYTNEGGFYWMQENATIILGVGSKPTYGMRMHIGLNGAWFIANEGLDFELSIIFDNQVVKIFSASEDGVYEIIIDPQLLPRKDSSDFYLIHLHANGYFDPSRMPDVFGFVPWGRELSYMLFLFEENS